MICHVIIWEFPRSTNLKNCVFSPSQFTFLNLLLFSFPLPISLSPSHSLRVSHNTQVGCGQGGGGSLSPPLQYFLSAAAVVFCCSEGWVSLMRVLQWPLPHDHCILFSWCLFVSGTLKFSEIHDQLYFLLRKDTILVCLSRKEGVTGVTRGAKLVLISSNVADNDTYFV